MKLNKHLVILAASAAIALSVCNGLTSDTTFSGIAASGGGSLTITSCSFSSNVGTVSASLSVTGVPVAIPYTVRYNYL